MNKFYKVVWNDAQGCWVAVSEVTKSQGKKSTHSSKKNKAGLAILATLGITFSPFALAAVGMEGGTGLGTAISKCEGDNTNADGPGFGGNGGAANSGSSQWGIAIGCSAYVHQESSGGANPADRANPYNNFDTNDQYGTLIQSKEGVSKGTVAGVAIGTNAYSNTLGTSLGPSARALGRSSTAIGVVAVAAGNTAIAVGRQSAAIGEYSISLGNVSAAVDDGAIAIGHSATATGYRGIAIGAPDIENADEVAGQSGANYQPKDQTLASGDDSIALGGGAQATAENALSIGAFSDANGKRSIALGTGSQATENDSIAIGDQANSSVVSGIAIGTNSKVTTANSVALGLNSATNAATGAGYLTNQALSNVSGVVSVGSSTEKRRIQNLADGSADSDAVTVAQLKQHKDITDQQGNDISLILGGGSSFNPDTGKIGAPTYNILGDNYTNVGLALQAATGHYYSVNDNGVIGANYNNDGAKGLNSLAAGIGASALAQSATAIGNQANVASTASNAVAIGRQANAGNTGAIAVGQQATAQDVNTIALGVEATAEDEDAIAIGQKSLASDNGAIALGNEATASENNAIAIGQNSSALANSAVALGWNANANRNGAVALGSSSSTVTAAQSVTNATINGLTYGNFAGRVTNDGMQVSVGSIGAERQVKNVAAGQISTTSTDAINGSQLYATNDVLGNLANSTQNIFGGNATLNANGNLSFTNIGGTGEDTIHDAIASVKTEVLAGTNIKNVVYSKDSNTGHSIYTVNALGASVSANDKYIKVVAETDANSNITNYYLDLSDEAKEDLGDNITSALQTIETQIDGQAVKTVEKDDNTVNFITGENIKLTAQDGAIEIATSDDVNFKNVTTNNLTTSGEVKLGDNFTVNNEGDVYYTGNITEGDHIVNKTYVDKSVAAAKTEVEEGKNITVVDRLGDDGQTIYVVSTSDDVEFDNVTTKNLTTSGEVKLGDNFTVNEGGDVHYTGPITEGDHIVNKDYVDNFVKGSRTEVVGGKNIVVKEVQQPGDDKLIYEVSTSDDVDFNNVTTNNLTASGEVKLGDKFEVNNEGDVYYSGDISEGDHIVNKTYVDKEAAAAKTEVVKGTNIASIDKETGAAGQDIYTVNAKGTTVSADEKYVKIVTKTDEETNITDYYLDLTDEVKDKLKDNIGNALKTIETQIDGEMVKSVSKNDNTMNFITGQNIKLDPVDGSIKISTADEVSFTKVTVGDTVINNDGLTIKDGPSITTGGINAGDLKITNVKDGEISNTSKDAVNGSQLYAVDKRIDNIQNNIDITANDLNNKIDDVKKKANAGIAAAMSFEPAPYVAGKWTYAAGTAYHSGEQGVGLSLRKTADNGRWSMTGGVAGATEGSVSFRIAASGVLF